MINVRILKFRKDKFTKFVDFYKVDKAKLPRNKLSTQNYHTRRILNFILVKPTLVLISPFNLWIHPPPFWAVHVR
jgi:hypothetical protein